MKNLTILFLLISLSGFTSQAEALDGAKLFRTNCKACHSIESDLVGPALKGLSERRDKEWIYSFIKNSQAMVEAGDETASELYMRFNQIVMPNQNVNDNEIEAILAYIDEESKPKMADANPIQRPVVDRGNNKPINFFDVIFWLPFTLSVFGAIGMFYYLTVLADIRNGRA